LFTFIDHFTKYVEAFPITDVSAETCARFYATQIIARHGSGSTLITDQGTSFTLAFFQETCKILKVRKARTSAYHAMSNGMVESFHRVLHGSIAHYIDSTGTNWNVVLPFLMAYRGTPRSTRGYSPFYLLHGPEMVLPNQGDLKAKVSYDIEDVDQVKGLENLKSSLKKAEEKI
jgi:transposase InsO family protein